MKKKLHNQFGEVIRKARTERQLTLKDVASRIGASPAYLSSIELNTEGQVPTDEMILKISSAVGLDFAALRKLSMFITPDLKAMRKKLSPTDAHNMQAFYKAAQDNNLSTKKALDIFLKALKEKRLSRRLREVKE